MEKTEGELNAVIGTEEEALWMKVKEAREASIKNLKDSLIVEQEILKLAESKLTNLLLL